MSSRDDVLTYATDIRDPLDTRRERTFHDGWQDALESGQYSEDTFEESSWQNLGNRLGCLFGDVSDEMRDELMFWAERQRRLDDQ